MALGYFIKDGKRDGIPTRIEVEVVEGVLCLDVAGIQRKRRVLIEIDLKDIEYLINRERVIEIYPESDEELDLEREPNDAFGRVLDADLDPEDAAQILGVGDVEDDFKPKT